MKEAIFINSSYPCINFDQVDLSDGCNANCIYCGLTKQKKHVKKLAVNFLLKHNYIPKGIYFSPNSDPFLKINCENTHSLLEKYLPLGVKVLIITKKFIPLKTINLLSKYSDQVIPKISLARIDEKISKYIESGADSPQKRLESIKNLTESGLKAQLLLMPLFPGIDDTNDKIEEIVEIANNCNVKYIKASYLIIRDSSREKDIEILNKIIKDRMLIKSWELMTEEISLQIGSGKILPFHKRIEFYNRINLLCKKKGIVFSACTVLDTSLKKIKQNSFSICDHVYSIYN